jgi:hypothetical protein
MGIPFLSPLFLTVPQQYNSYTYSFNNPINYYDQEGLAVTAIMRCAYYAYRAYKLAKLVQGAACSTLSGFSYIVCMRDCVCGDKKKCEDDLGKINRCKNKCFRVMVGDYKDCMKRNKSNPPSNGGNGFGGSGASGGW